MAASLEAKLLPLDQVVVVVNICGVVEYISRGVEKMRRIV